MGPGVEESGLTRKGIFDPAMRHAQDTILENRLRQLPTDQLSCGKTRAYQNGQSLDAAAPRLLVLSTLPGSNMEISKRKTGTLTGFSDRRIAETGQRPRISYVPTQG